MTTALERLQAAFYNNGLKSAGNPGGLSGAGALRINGPALFADIAQVCGDAADAQAAAEAAAAGAANAPGTGATSASVIPIPALGDSVNVVLNEMNKAFVKGQTLVCSSDATPLDQFVGVMTAFVPATGHLTIKVQFVSPGWATHNLWNLGLTPQVDGTLTGRVGVLEAAADDRAQEDIYFGRKVY